MIHPAAAKIAEVVKAAPRVVLVTHAEPDGDAVGSVLGFAHALRALGRAAVAWPLDPPPRRYAFLPGFEELAAGEPPAWREGDVVVAIGGREVTKAREVQMAVLRTPPGKSLPITVRRKGKLHELEARPARRRAPLRIF